MYTVVLFAAGEKLTYRVDHEVKLVSPYRTILLTNVLMEGKILSEMTIHLGANDTLFIYPTDDAEE